MQFIEMGNVDIAEAIPLHPPPGSVVLIDSSLVQEETEHAAIFAIAPRDSFEDAVLGMDIVNMAANVANTNWPIRVSFPIFVNNVLRYLGGGGRSFPTEIDCQTWGTRLHSVGKSGDRNRCSVTFRRKRVVGTWLARPFYVFPD